MTIAEEFTRYAEWVADKSPLYGKLTKATADDTHILDIASEASEGQPPPQLLLAAVHALLLEGRDHPLRRFYPSCGGDTSDEDPVPYFRDFCVANEEQLRDLIARRRCQTNDIGRSAVLLPAFEHVAQTAETRTLAQIEIGASAGLNLNWNRYQYCFNGVDRVGDPHSPVKVTTEVRGNHHPLLPQSFPSVCYQRGIDLNPLDATDPKDARWLHALVHPNQDHRHEQLEAAIEVARQKTPQLIEGDVLTELPSLLSEAPDDAALIVYSTHVLYQLDEQTVTELRSLLSSYSSEQPIHWLSIDPSEELGTPIYRHVMLADGATKESQIAQFESYGEWIRWLEN